MVDQQENAGDTKLGVLLDDARQHLRKFGKVMHRALSAVEAILLFTGGALTAWGAVQLELDQDHIGVPMVAAGIAVTAIYVVLQWLERDNPIATVIEKLSLAEEAYSQQKIAAATIGERDRLLAESIHMTKQLASLGKQFHETKANMLMMARHREAMLLSLDNINLMASTLIEERPKSARHKVDLADQLTKAFAPMRYSLANAFNIDSKDELWTFSIYSKEVEGGRHVMRRLVAVSSDGQEENDQRKWPKGEGFVGEAWASGGELIVPDRNEKRFAKRFHAKPANNKAADAKLYVSVAIMPVRIGPTDESDDSKNIAGCVIATSNKAGRFLDDESDPRALNAALVRQLASIVRLLVISWRSSQSTHFSTEPLA